MPEGATAWLCLPQCPMTVPSALPLPLWASSLVKCQPGLNRLTKATRRLCSWLYPCLAVPGKASSPSLHGSSLRKEFHMVQWMYKMVEIYGFRILFRLLWWFRVGPEPKPLITHTDLGGIWNLDPLLKSASDSSLATHTAFYGFISIPGGHFNAYLVADRGGGDLYMIYIQGNAYITTSLFL